jgi:hypothetical protein
VFSLVAIGACQQQTYHLREDGGLPDQEGKPQQRVQRRVHIVQIWNKYYLKSYGAEMVVDKCRKRVVSGGARQQLPGKLEAD